MERSNLVGTRTPKRANSRRRLPPTRRREDFNSPITPLCKFKMGDMGTPSPVPSKQTLVNQIPLSTHDKNSMKANVNDRRAYVDKLDKIRLVMTPHDLDMNDRRFMHVCCFTYKPPSHYLMSPMLFNRVASKAGVGHCPLQLVNRII